MSERGGPAQGNGPGHQQWQGGGRPPRPARRDDYGVANDADEDGGLPVRPVRAASDGRRGYSGDYDYTEPFDYFGRQPGPGPQAGGVNGNGAPPHGYGSPANGYGAPANGYGAPGNGHAPPNGRQRAPEEYPGRGSETMRLGPFAGPPGPADTGTPFDVPADESDDAPESSPPSEAPTGGRAERRRAAKRIKRRRRLSVTKEIPILVGVALLIALVLKTFLVQAFVIPSGSMEQTIRIGDRVLVDKLTPWFGTKPERGDVVVFKDPGGWLGSEEAQRKNDPVGVKQGKEFMTFIGLLPSDNEQDLIKRVVGVGGDKVKCCDPQGKVTVNGTPLKEPYLHPGNKPSQMNFDVTVPIGRVFVMGDHRANSADSRFHLRDPGNGTVPEDLVVGRAVVIAWPFNHWRKLEERSTYTSVRDAPGAASAASGAGNNRIAPLPSPAELPLVMGVVGLSRLSGRRLWTVRRDGGGLGGRRSFRFRRRRGRRWGGAQEP